LVTISISPAAFAAIEATLPDDREAEARPDGKGGYLVALPHGVLDRLGAMRGPGESYSDVIIRVARAAPFAGHSALGRGRTNSHKSTAGLKPA
jgi:hypothetical protein